MAMTLVHGIDSLESSAGRLFVVIGVFDGLHRGHEYLLDELRAAATAHDARPAVITFDHHPDEILTGQAPPLLCDPEERLQRLEAAGVAVTVVQTFDLALRETPFDAFVRMITDRTELAGFLMTPGSGFGFERRGTPETVAELGHELGFDVVVVPPFALAGEPVSSSAIRASIAWGDFVAAERLLGRPYVVIGAIRSDGAEHADPSGVPIAFDVPVALPPDGRFGIEVRWAHGAPEAGWASVDNGVLRVTGTAASPPSGRTTVTFAVI